MAQFFECAACSPVEPVLLHAEQLLPQGKFFSADKAVDVRDYRAAFSVFGQVNGVWVLRHRAVISL